MGTGVGTDGLGPRWTFHDKASLRQVSLVGLLCAKHSTGTGQGPCPQGAGIAEQRGKRVVCIHTHTHTHT